MKLRESLINMSLVVFMALCGVVTWHMYQLNHSMIVNPPASRAAGDALDIDIAKLNAIVPPAKSSVVMFLQSSCGYRKQSLPLYRDLMNSSAVKSGKVQMVAILPDPKATVQKYLDDNKIVV